MPCVRLYKSLYGHPESGGRWRKKFAGVIQERLGRESASFPSNFWIESSRLLVALYVDDFLLSGPTKERQKFWQVLQSKLDIEEPSPIDKVLGRKRVVKREGNSLVYLRASNFVLAN